MRRAWLSRQLLVLLAGIAAGALLAIACSGSDPDLGPAGDTSLVDGATTPGSDDGGPGDGATSDATTPTPIADAATELLRDPTFDDCSDIRWVTNGVTMQSSTASADGGKSCLVCSNQSSTYSIYQLVRVDGLTPGNYVAAVTVGTPPDASVSRAVQLGLYYDDGIDGTGDYGGPAPIDMPDSGWVTQTRQLGYEGADGGFLEIRIESKFASVGDCFLIDHASLTKE